MAMHLLAAVPVSQLRQAIGSLEDAHFEITSALDMLFQGV